MLKDASKKGSLVSPPSESSPSLSSRRPDVDVDSSVVC